MMDEGLLLLLEISILFVLVGLGIWRIYRTLQSVKINPPAPLAVLAPLVPAVHDMRQEGQQSTV